MNKRILNDREFYLRPVEPNDAEFMWEVENDSLQWIQNSMMAPFSKENLLDYALNYNANPFSAGQIRLIFQSKKEGRIGIVDLFEISAQHRTAKIGIYILPSFREKGVSLVALSLLEDYACNILNLRELCADVIETNKKSLALFLKREFVHVGTLNNWILCGNKTFSLLILQKSLINQIK